MVYREAPARGVLSWILDRFTRLLFLVVFVSAGVLLVHARKET